MAGILYANYYIPKGSITIADYFSDNPSMRFPARYSSLNEYFEDIKQYQTVSFWDKEDPLEKSCELLSDFFQKERVNPKDISYLIYTDDITSANGTSIPRYLHRKYKMSNASICPIIDSCSSSLSAVELSTDILLSQKGKYAIILSGVSIPEFEQRFMPMSILGDGIGILVVTREPTSYEIIDCASHTSGSGSYEVEEGIGVQLEATIGLGFLKDFVTSISKLRAMLVRNKLSIDDIGIAIPQNAYNPTVEDIFKLLGIPLNRVFFTNCSSKGSMANVDMIRNLKDFSCSSPPCKGAYILLFAIGTKELKNLTSIDSDFRYVLLRRNGE